MVQAQLAGMLVGVRQVTEAQERLLLFQGHLQLMQVAAVVEPILPGLRLELVAQAVEHRDQRLKQLPPMGLPIQEVEAVAAVAAALGVDPAPQAAQASSF